MIPGGKPVIDNIRRKELEANTCRGCYFAGQCEPAKRCAYYTPLDPADEEAAMRRMVEKGKEEFQAVWEIYANEYDG